MRVYVYLLEDGVMAAMVQASPGKGRAPVMVQAVTCENVVEKLLPVVAQMRLPRGVKLPPAV